MMVTCFKKTKKKRKLNVKACLREKQEQVCILGLIISETRGLRYHVRWNLGEEIKAGLSWRSFWKLMEDLFIQGEDKTDRFGGGKAQGALAHCWPIRCGLLTQGGGKRQTQVKNSGEFPWGRGFDPWPRSAQWVKDPAWLWAVVYVADTARIWCGCGCGCAGGRRLQLRWDP